MHACLQTLDEIRPGQARDLRNAAWSFAMVQPLLSLRLSFHSDEQVSAVEETGVFLATPEKHQPPQLVSTARTLAGDNCTQKPSRKGRLREAFSGNIHCSEIKIPHTTWILNDDIFWHFLFVCC